MRVKTLVLVVSVLGAVALGMWGLDAYQRMVEAKAYAAARNADTTQGYREFLHAHPQGEAQIAATIFGLNGGPMMLGDDIDRMTEERLALIRRCLPRLPECARPLDLFDCPEPDYVKTFHLRVEAGWDQWDILAILNYGADALRQNIEKWDGGIFGDDLENSSVLFLVWDFWTERYEGTRTAAFEVWVAPNSAKVLRLSRKREHPWILSTDMHVRQGQAEIEDCRWNADAMALTFRASRPAGETGNVFVHVPEGLFVANPEGLWIAKDANDSSLIVRVAFEFGDEPDERTIRFGRV